MGARLTMAAMAALLAFGPGMASAQMTAPVVIDMPAQSLDQALKRLAETHGLQIFYAPQTVAGMQAPALSGSMTPQQALAALLQGKPLRLRQEGSATIIEPEAAGAATVLAPIEVSASRTASNLVSPVQQTIVLERDALQELRTGSDSLATVLAKTVPGMADSSRTMTDYGQTLRGRGVLVLV
ncbi:STN domain-containing protein, partial [Bifidobacterium pseudocatenulatum]|uniref:STN domain-containing protein n=1 Tax=Bifidobacterium pseudocatenulatum TaxID=28026 RepID=UPI0019D35C0F